MNMKKMDKDPAVKIYDERYNCCQAVLGAYCEQFGMDVDTALRLASGMGGGMGGMQEKCGAMVGLFLLSGLKSGTFPPDDEAAKEQSKARILALNARFEEYCSSTICRDIKQQAESEFSGVPGLKDLPFDAEHPCRSVVFAASQIFREVLDDSRETAE